ncbi:MAG: hypothetical protein JO033_22245 [Acidobacteriaceae bacterium]|nr:hypothetical protein [Acidobacteriaceae bacterium]MBV9502088.1 hypothetical protein [Acidobacteriaceae bacterium]
MIGSGNLSGGGFLANIECGQFSEDDEIFKQADKWFNRLFDDDELTSALRGQDIRRYRKRFDTANQKNKEIQALQHEAEDEIADRTHPSLGRWKMAIADAIQFFKSKTVQGILPRGPQIHRQENQAGFALP